MSIKEEESAKLLRIEKSLHKRVIRRTSRSSRWPAPFAVRVPD